MENWYVYYALSADQRAEALPRIRSMQHRLEAEHRVSARLEQRIDRKDAVTWMEIYEGIVDPAGFEAALSAAFAGAGLAPELGAARRIERFAPL